MLKKSLILVGLLIFVSTVFAQSVDEVGAKYNEGNESYNAKDYAQAIDAYQAGLEMAKEVGMDADDLKASIEKQLGNAYYKNGITLYKAKDLDGSLAVLDKGYAFVKEIGNSKSEKKYVSVIAQVRSKKGDALRKEKKLDEAYAEYQLALDVKPSCVKAFYGQGMVYKTKGDMEKMMEKMDKVIENGEGNSKAAKTVAAAKTTAAKSLYNAAL
jgi:tetratricopeptide (TPR) repeat protein